MEKEIKDLVEFLKKSAAEHTGEEARFQAEGSEWLEGFHGAKASAFNQVAGWLEEILEKEAKRHE